MADKYWWESEEPKAEKQGYWWDDGSTSSTVSNDITNRVNTWLKNHNTYVNNYQSRNAGRKYNYEDSYVKDSASWLDTVSKQKKNFDAEAASILSYMDQYKGYLDEDWMKSVRDTLVSGLNQQKIVLENSQKDNQWWSSFRDETEYGYNQKYNGQNYESIQKALSTLDDGSDEKDWLASNQFALYQQDKTYQSKSLSGLKSFEAQKVAERNKEDEKSWFDNVLASFANTGDTTLPAANLTTVTAAYRDDTSYREPSDLWTEGQKREFGYRYAEDPNKAYAYAEQLNNYYASAEKYAKQQAIGAKASENLGSGILHTIGAVATAPMGLADYLDDVAEYAGRGTITQKGNITPFEYSQAAQSGISNKLNQVDENGVAQRVLPDWVPVMGGKGWGDVYGLGVSAVNSMLSAYTMGGGGTLVNFIGQGGAAGVDDALRRGATPEQAILYGTIVGSLEGLTEAIPAGDLMKVGSSATMKNYLKKAVNQGFEELLEEGASSFLGNLADDLVMQDKSNFKRTVAELMEADKNLTKEEAEKKAFRQMANDLAFDAVGGFATGSANAMTVGGISNMFDARKGNVANIEAVKQYGDSTKELIQEGLESDSKSESFQLAHKYYRQRQKGKELTGFQIRNLVNANEAQIAVENYDSAVTTAKKNLAELGETKNVDKVAKLVAKRVTGQELTRAEKNTLVSSQYGSKVAKDILDTAKENQVTYKPITDRVGEESRYGVSKSGQTEIRSADVEVEGEPIKIKEVSKIEDGQLTVKLEDGREVYAGDIDFATESESFLYSAIADMENMTPAAATALVKNFDESSKQTTQEYVNGIDEAYNYGYRGYSVEDMKVGDYAIHLSNEQMMSAYKLGQSARKIGIEAHDAPLVKMRTAQQATVSKKEMVAQQKARFESDAEVYFMDGKNVVKFDEHTGEYDDVRMAGVTAAKAFRKMGIGSKYFFYESYEKDGKRYYKDAAGVEKIAPNGIFTAADGSIYIDLNAGEKGQGTTVYTLGHELGHFVKHSSEKQFQRLGDLVTEAYSKTDMTMHERVVMKQNTLSEIRGEHVTYDEAYEEVVCDALSTTIADGSFYEKVMEIKVKDKGLFNSIKRFFENLISKFKEIYESLTPDQKDAQDIREMKDMFDKIQTAFAEALVEASDNFHASEKVLAEAGISVDSNTDAGSLYSVRDVLSETDRNKVAKTLADRFDVTQEEAMEWLKAETSLASLILNPKYSAYLDYEGDPNEVAIKQNSDYPQGTVDFSNICKKRREFTQVMNRILRNFPNHVFAATDLAKIRTIMGEEGMTLPCGICYVEDRRQLDTIVAQDFINGLKLYREGSKTRPDGKPFNANQLKGLQLTDGDDYVPSIYELVTLEGRNSLKAKNPNMEAAWVRYNNARGMQAVRLLTNEAEYKRQILKYNKKTVQSKNDHGGLRIYSFSDAEMFHLIDIIQVITDSAAVGLSLQGYTKVNEYAKAVKDTGEKLNRSLIPKGDLGYHMENGKVVLDYDTVEGIDIYSKDFFDNKDNPNVGNITIGINDVQIRAAMVSDFVDQIIPFHTGQSEEVLGEKGIAAWDNYKDSQTEKDIATGRTSAHQVNIYTEVFQAAEAEGKPIQNKRQFVEKFLQVCKENGLQPRFSQFLNTDANGDYIYTEGYHKFLVDFKTFAQTKVGEYLPQMPAKPIFDDAYITGLLKDYVKEQQAKDTEVAKQMPKVIERITNEIVKPAVAAQPKDAGVKNSDRTTGFQEHDVVSAVYTIRNEKAKRGHDLVKIGSMPALYRDLFDLSGDVYVSNEHLYQNMVSRAVAEAEGRFNPDASADYHELGEPKVINAIEQFQDPLVIMESLKDFNEPRLVAVLDEKGNDGQNLLAVMELYAPMRPHGVSQLRNHVLITIYEKNSLPDYIEKTVDKGRILHKKEGSRLTSQAGLQLAGEMSSETLKKNVARFNKKVKDFKAQNKIFYSDRDSAGKQLSEGQQEFFKDSKARDKKGRLLTLYHGSDSRFTVYDTSKSDDKASIFLTDKRDVAQSYTYNRRDVDPYDNFDADTAPIEDVLERYHQHKPDDHLRVMTKAEIQDAKNTFDTGKKNAIQKIVQMLDAFEKVGYNSTFGYRHMKRGLDGIQSGNQHSDAYWLDMIAENLNRIMENDFPSARPAVEAAQKAVGAIAESASILREMEYSDTILYRVENLRGWDKYISDDRVRREVRMANRGGVIPLYANITNPFEVDAEGKNWNKVKTPAAMLSTGKYGTTVKTREISLFAKENGYDGVIIRNLYDLGGRVDVGKKKSTVLIAFDSNQIKSVDNKNPTTDPDIRYSDRDYTSYDRRAILKESKVDEYLYDYAAKSSPKYAQAYIAYVRPRTFLKLTTDDVFERYHIADQAGELDDERLSNSRPGIYLRIDHETGQVTGHEGRHRMSAMDGAGIELVPVLLVDTSNKMTKTDIAEITLHGQFDETAMGIVRDLIPLNYENRDRVIKNFATQSSTQRIGERYGFNKTLRFSERTGDSVSNRALLANAFEGISQNSVEYKMIQDYKSRIKELNELETKLSQLNAEIRKIRFGKGEYDAEKLRQLEDEAKEIAGEINRYDKRLLNMEASEPLRKVIDRERKKEAQKTKDHVKQIQENKKVRAEQAELRHKIRKAIRDLDKILNRGNKKRNVKEDMKGFASKALDLADYLFTDHISNDELIRRGITVPMRGNEPQLVKETEEILSKLYDHADSLTDEEFTRLDEKRKRNMEKLRDLLKSQRNERLNTPVYNLFNDLVTEYASLKNSKQDAVKAAYNPEVERFLRTYIGESADGTDSDRKTLLQNMRVADMTTDELWRLHNAYKMVLHTVRTANDLFVKGKAASIQEMADRITWDFSSRKIPEGKLAIVARNLSNKIGWDYEKLHYALDRIGSEAFADLVMNIANSENTVMQDIMEAAVFRDKIVEKYGYNNWAVNKEIDREFLDNTGKKFKLTLGQLMALYAYSRREGALDHLEYGGFVFGEAALTNPRPADTYKINKAQCDAITSLLTAKQKAYAEEMQKFLSETMGEKGNEVSMLLYGIKMFGEKNYFPIHVAGQFKAQAQESQAKAAAGFSSMSNAGFTHEQNRKAKAPIVLEGFNEIWTDHVNEMSRYHGTVPALEDMRRVMNRSSYSEASAESMAIKQLMENAYGKEAVAYFDNLYREANSGAITDRLQKTSKKLLSMFRKNSVAYSLSVLIQQPASLVRAYSMIDKKYFGFKGFGTITSGVAKAVSSKWNKAYSDAYNEMLKYAPGVTMAKEIGGFDTATGGSIRSYLLDTNKSLKQKWKTGTIAEKGSAVMDLVDNNAVANLPNVADKIAWIEIWNACKREAVAKHKDLKPGSDEFLQAVGDRFTEVIRATQVYDSIFAKSPMLKSKTLAVQYLVSFMNEPNTVANMVEKAVRDVTTGDVKQGVRTAAVVVHSIIFTNVLKSLIYAMRDDDEDESYIEKYIESIVGNMMNDFNALNYIPLARDVWSLAQGYDVERADMAIVADAIDAVEKVIKYKTTDTEDMTEEQLIELDKKQIEANWKLAESVASFFGIPAKNIRREINGVLDHARIAKANAGQATKKSISDTIYDAVVESIPFMSSNKKSKQDKLYDAIMSGDKQYLGRIKSTYKTEDAYQSAVRKALRENDPRIHDAASAKYEGKTEEYKRIFRQIQKEGKFSFDDIMNAINSEISAIKKDTEPASVTSDYSATDFVNAISLGETSAAKSMREEIIEAKVANGDTRDEAEESFADSVATAARKAYDSDLLDEAGVAEVLTAYAGIDDEEADAKVNYWSFCKAHPQYDLSESNVEDYWEFAEPAEVPLDVYVQYVDRTKDLGTIRDEWGEEVKSKREQVLEVIDSLPLSWQQKDALYLAAGYAESKIMDVPW